MPATTAPTEIAAARVPRLRLEPAHAILVGLLVLEIAVFAAIGTNFFSLANAFEVLRLSVEIGLLAVALTPVITTGGIDLSVGSLMGLSAVVFGKLWRDGGLSIGMAAVATFCLGALAGGLNGLLITRGRIPALIVTLGSFSMFRGLAEGLTGGVDNFTHFPDRFLFLGQGYSLGGVPTQVPVFVIVAAVFWVLLHRTTIGRGLVAIGFSSEGARYAGLPVERLVGLVYLLSGLVASLAAVIYVAHLGQAKADAGTGYELAAITAVVLGGTSIFGGRGSVPGTLLGLFAIAVLQNGLRLADLPSELAGVLTGTLLLVAIGLDHKPTPGHVRRHVPSSLETMTVKNSQVAVICIAILAAALINAVSNVIVVRSLRSERASPLSPASPTAIKPSTATAAGASITVAMMPKSKGNAYFIACRKGAEEAAGELGVKLIWDGPTDPDPAKQNEVIDTWITRGVDDFVLLGRVGVGRAVPNELDSQLFRGFLGSLLAGDEVGVSLALGHHRHRDRGGAGRAVEDGDVDVDARAGGLDLSLLSDWIKKRLLKALIKAAARMVTQMSATCEFFTVIISKDVWACRAVRPGVGFRSSPMATSKSVPVKTPASSEGRSARRRPF